MAGLGTARSVALGEGATGVGVGFGGIEVAWLVVTDLGDVVALVSVKLPLSVLREELCVLDEGVLEAENDADPVSEVRRAPDSVSELCERLLTLKDCLLETGVKVEAIFEDWVDSAEVTVDVAWELDNVDERDSNDKLLLEDSEGDPSVETPLRLSEV